ncbi:MAG TPA: hypothetical protein VF152_02640 [Acidimicrobiia bacterium]
MRRLRMLAVAGLAVGSVTTWVGTGNAARGSEFCETARNAFDDIDDEGLVDPGDFEVSEEQAEQVLDFYEELEEEAPKKLRKPFRTIRRFYAQLADGDLDLSDPDDIEVLVNRGVKVGRAGVKIYNYLVDECGVQLPDVSVPDVSIPDVSIPDITSP